LDGSAENDGKTKPGGGGGTYVKYDRVTSLYSFSSSKQKRINYRAFRIFTTFSRTFLTDLWIRFYYSDGKFRFYFFALPRSPPGRRRLSPAIPSPILSHPAAATRSFSLSLSLSLVLCPRFISLFSLTAKIDFSISQ